jgi:acetyl esterase/lipase
VRVESSQIAGVRVFVVTPAELAPQNRERLLVHVHGGGYVLFPGEAGAGEAMLMAAYGRFKCVSIDYRMPPDFPFPAALDDAMAVWRALLRSNDPRRMAIFGSSSGGGLTLAMVLRAKSEGLPLPAAIAPGTPWADLTGNGDSIMANAFVDNVLVANTGWVGAAAPLYAAGRDLRDPLLSPLYGDFSGFPPAIVTSGTRDLLLSDSVRVHRKLRQAGVEAALQVFEGQSHAQFLDPFVPALGCVLRANPLLEGFLSAPVGDVTRPLRGVDVRIVYRHLDL